jgi:hyperosmotically inducible protein
MSRWFASLLLISSLSLAPFAYAAQDKKQHEDAFMRGSGDEGRIAQEVRHQLVMLPYYGIFDDLAFRVDGSTVTLLGSVT